MIPVKCIFIVCIASLLCGCLRASEPIVVKRSNLTDAQQTKYHDMVLTKRVFVEHGKEKVTIYVDVREKDVTATSNFGMENEIANLNCIEAGIHQAIKASTIIPPEKFWDAIGENYETLKLSTLFDKSYLSKFDNIGVDYLFIAHHQRIRVESVFGEFVFLGTVGYEYEEKASALIVDIKQGRILDAIETKQSHRTGVNHWYFVPAYVGTYPEEDLCVAIGRRAAELIARSLKDDRAPQILVVAAKTYPYTPPYTEVTGIEHDYAPNAATQNSASSRENGCIGTACSGWSANTVGITREAGIYCPNADLGHADAQVYVGDLYYLGAYDLDKDIVQAYVWYSLAEANGSPYASEKVVKLQNEMSDEILAAAQLKIEQWQPGTCRQDLLEAAAGSPE
jgi:TPR repeat protein